MHPEWWFETFGTAFMWATLAIVFVECGLLFPFLPGDSLLFTVGLLIGNGAMQPFGASAVTNVSIALALMAVAAFGGNVAGYEIGRAVGEPLYERDGRILKRKYFDQTHAFFDKYGAKALILGRFVPIVRTFVTVVAGVGKMPRSRFYTWSGVGAVLWVSLMTLMGYFLGGIPWVGENLTVVAGLIILISVMPIGVEWFLQRRRAARARAAVASDEVD